MAKNFTQLGTEIQVNLDPNTLNQQFSSDVVALSDGRFFVAYVDSPNNSDTNIIGQFINADGSVSTHSFGATGPEGDAGFQFDPAVAKRADGGVVVAWADRGIGPTPNIQLAVLNANGVNVTTATELDAIEGTSDKGDANFAPDVATFANGQSVVVWQRNFNSSDHDIHARVLKADGTGFTTENVIDIDNEDSNAKSDRPAVAASGNNALIAYEDERNGAVETIRAVLFNADTGTVGESIVIANHVGKVEEVDVAALTDGRYVVVYDDEDTDDVFAQIVDAAGNKVGPEIVVANGGGDQDDARVTALADGGFMVTWEDDSSSLGDAGGDAIHARRFLADGTPGGDELLVNTLTDGSQNDPAIAVNAAGNVFVAFNDSAVRLGDASQGGIRGGLFTPTNDPVNGTEGADALLTYNLSEIINALGGNDSVNAAGGNDSISGGLGLDSLTGGAGADAFVFNTAIKPKGSNIDTILDFSSIDDTIVLDNAVFRKLKAGELKAKFFEEGRRAHDGNDHIIYNDKTGALIYDKNGDDKGGAVQFATLQAGLDLSKADFFVV